MFLVKDVLKKPTDMICIWQSTRLPSCEILLMLGTRLVSSCDESEGEGRGEEGRR